MANCERFELETSIVAHRVNEAWQKVVLDGELSNPCAPVCARAERKHRARQDTRDEPVVAVCLLSVEEVFRPHRAARSRTRARAVSFAAPVLLGWLVAPTSRARGLLLPRMSAREVFWYSDAGRKPEVEAHLNAGATVEYVELCGRTPLIAAAEGGHSEVVKLLLTKNAKTDAKTEDGWTPLMVAARGGHKEVVELLLAGGADAGAKDNTGREAAHIARLNGHEAIAALLGGAPQ